MQWRYITFAEALPIEAVCLRFVSGLHTCTGCPIRSLCKAAGPEDSMTEEIRMRWEKKMARAAESVVDKENRRYKHV